ncbi:glycoside hydrolase family 61 protein [Lophiotrema nucula]|uniref:AA9 family lytic polysaccharide monooxygenase n=1 Tax=Lophiotrema nucula TaxID=690887 RepID=A0A6A5ZSD6_9PLEO|nr:glycoside hydrolase family 61 protein [Lophiotrema nucula]
MFSKTLLVTGLFSLASAHQNFHQFWVNGETPGYQVSIRMLLSNSPVTDVTSNDIACNVNGDVVPSGVDTVAASEGDTIKVQWDQSTHPGPITHMLFGPVDDAAQATGIGSWFKIDELDYVNGTWANEIMSAQNMTREFKLLTGLASGEYLLRSEMLALHGAQTVGGAQFYIGCAQLKITGTGSSSSCGPTIKLPGAYSAEDADIYIPNIYNGYDPSNYTAPGGPIATCDGSGATTPVASSSAVAAPASSAAASSSAVIPVSSVTASSSAIASPSDVLVVSSAVVPEAANMTAAPIATPISSLPPVAEPTYPAGNSTFPILPSTFATSVVRTSAAAAPTGTDGTVAKKYYQW